MAGVYLSLKAKLVAAAATAVYLGVDARGRRDVASHLTQSVASTAVAIAAGDCAYCRGIVWLALVVSIVHTMNAVYTLELIRMGDCRACCNEFHLCQCGKEKRTLPAGTLAYLALLLQRRWRTRKGSTLPLAANRGVGADTLEVAIERCVH